MIELKTAVKVADEAHRRQKDKEDKPYTLHPIKVIPEIKTAEEREGAVLRDEVKDRNWITEEFLDEGFSEKT